MPNSPKPTDQQQVTQHIQNLDASIKDTVETLRQIILNVSDEISERIKWNNPSFYYNGEMQPFDPKEYKREMIVFNLHKNRIMLVFPSGAKVNDTTGLLTGNYADGRRIVVFKDMEDVKARKADLHLVITKWLKLVDK
ncbi:DUF1801 domain-containing protein [Mucilaginibacter flavidus]|uniref:DUF1801 domain-containing protein n=1 Tax=Mucilaginibacter flavidus TaxID=2949309 RepID=UPI0020937334|nr:DUF1801 domain-containing protein [Mucilaginibacter flavidus]MCO5945650.1 DUF1801 domain-containing protein [Mucilaginibacter flavidus]